MASIGGDNFPYFTNNELELREIGRRPTLGELLKRVEDAQSPDHSVVDVSYGCRYLAEAPLLYPFKLSFRNLSYSVKVRGRGGGSSLPENLAAEESGGRVKLLLNDISGEAREGEIMAVLGASGSGKSTLIDALADRIAKGSFLVPRLGLIVNNLFNN